MKAYSEVWKLGTKIAVCDGFVSETNDKILTRINESNENLEVDEVQNMFEDKHVGKRKRMMNYEGIDEAITNSKVKLTTVDVYN